MSGDRDNQGFREEDARCQFTAHPVGAFDTNLASAREAPARSADDHLTATIPAIGMTRLAVLRTRVMSHMIHHRGHLSVYLRLLDTSVPGMYGPSADETAQSA